MRANLIGCGLLISLTPRPSITWPSTSLSQHNTHLHPIPTFTTPQNPQFLDNTIPGTDDERGISHWVHKVIPKLPAPGADGVTPGDAGDAVWRWWEDDYMNAVYGLPFNMTRRWEAGAGAKLRAASDRVMRPVGAALAPARRVARALLTCGGHCGPQPDPESSFSLPSSVGPRDVGLTAAGAGGGDAGAAGLGAGPSGKESAARADL